MNAADEANKIWKALKTMVDAEIAQKTKSCIRTKKMRVTTAPQNGLMGVSEAFGQEIFIPYRTGLEQAQVGDSVMVYIFWNDASTMTAMHTGSGAQTWAR